MLRHPRQRDHHGEAEPEARKLVEPQRGVVAGGAPEHEHAEHADRHQRRQQHAVEAQRAQQPRRRGDGAARARGGQSLVHHSASGSR